MNVDHVPVRDFSGSADPLRDMHRTYVEARRRMEQPRVKAPPTLAPAAAPIPAPAPVPVIAMIPPPDYVMTKEAYQRAVQIRRENEAAYRPILRVVSAVTGVPITALTGRNSTGDVRKARVIAFYLIRRNTVLSYPQIGRRMNRHHTCPINGASRVTRAIRHLRIELSSDPVEACDQLWSAKWPPAKL